MKLPKVRDNLFIVVREDSVNIGAFSSIEDADNYAAACQQSFFEKTGLDVKFEVQMLSFYG